MTPFIIYALPRSRTAWLSRFLTYGDYRCEHEQARHIRSAADAAAWLSQDFTGAAETAAAPWWRFVQAKRPDIRTVVVRRPVAQVVDSLMALKGVVFDRETLTAEMHRQDARLDRIEHRVPGVLSVRFDDLADEAVCARVFEHCLPYRHDAAWWKQWDALNVQADMRALMRYGLAHRALMDRAVAEVTHQIRAGLTAGRATTYGDGMTIQQEDFETFWRDAQPLFAEHCIQIGQPADQWRHKNLPMFRKLDALGMVQIVTARCNGRMFGYLATILSPSLEHMDRTVGMQATFFATADAKGAGLGLKLQRAAIAAAKTKGAAEVMMYAGVRADGPRLGILYRRLGAKEFGHLYKLELKAA